jgi:hypothetical protein
MKAVLLGSSGMVGKGVLMECLEDSRVQEILLVNRKSAGISHPKVKEIIHADFENFYSLKERLNGYDVCFFCLGVTSAGLDEKQYAKITYTITLNFAHTFISANPSSVFCYVSGAGTDSTEKGRSMWARVKGKTENDLLKLPFKAAYMFRPAYIQPLKRIKSKTGWYNAVYFIFKPLYFLLKPFKSFVTDTASLGKAMIKAASNGYEKKVVESKDIYILSH